MKNSLLLIVLIIVSNSIKTHAQSNTNTAGGDGINTDCSISYSVGQLAYVPTYSISSSISPGVQQTYKTNTNSIFNLLKETVDVYPNPIIDNLNITLNEQVKTKYVLYNASGTIILSGLLYQHINSINISGLSSGIYYLKINKDILKITKI